MVKLKILKHYTGEMNMTDVKTGYSLKIGLKKFAVDAAIVILSGLMVIWQEDPKYMVAIPVIKLAINWIKHR